ncbi:unnamed protein product, partial [marine sediment metagenome]
ETRNLGNWSEDVLTRITNGDHRELSLPSPRPAIEETNMKCINCGKEAEYILIFSKAVPMMLTITTFTYGGSYCTKCFTEFKKKAEKELQLIMTANKKIYPDDARKQT